MYAMDWVRLIVAGFLGALMMSVVGLFPRVAGQPAIDLGQIMATKILRLHMGPPTALGIALHFANGVAFAVVYGTVFAPWLPGPPWAQGLLFALLLWLMLMVVVLPLVAEGWFGLRQGLRVPLITLLMHLAYGAALGSFYGP